VWLGLGLGLVLGLELVLVIWIGVSIDNLGSFFLIHSRHPLNFSEARDDGVTLAGPYGNHLHLAPDR